MCVYWDNNKKGSACAWCVKACPLSSNITSFLNQAFCCLQYCEETTFNRPGGSKYEVVQQPGCTLQSSGSTHIAFNDMISQKENCKF